MSARRNVLFDTPLPKEPPGMRGAAGALAFWFGVGAIEYHQQWQTTIGRVWQVFSVSFAPLMVSAFALSLILRFRRPRHPHTAA